MHLLKTQGHVRGEPTRLSPDQRQGALCMSIPTPAVSNESAHYDREAGPTVLPVAVIIHTLYQLHFHLLRLDVVGGDGGLFEIQIPLSKSPYELTK